MVDATEGTLHRVSTTVCVVGCHVLPVLLRGEGFKVSGGGGYQAQPR